MTLTKRAKQILRVLYALQRCSLARELFIRQAQPFTAPEDQLKLIKDCFDAGADFIEAQTNHLDDALAEQ